MEYLLENKKFRFSYSDLKSKYEYFIRLSDEEFLEVLPSAIHFACFVCFFKEIQTKYCLSDVGILHELIHLLDIEKETLNRLKEIRHLFKNELKM